MVPNLENFEQYAEQISQKEPPLLHDLNRETHQKVLKPRMISGPLQGRLLSLISKLIQPKMILDIGTFTGYSALCLAEGLPDNGVLHTVDKNEELLALQQKYFHRSRYSAQIIQHLGNALEIIPELKEGFDLVFIDADKKNYSRYFDLIFPKLNPGGVVISDNVLWYGKVIQETSKNDIDTTIIKAFNRKIQKDERLESVLLPIRDGVLISRKK